MFSSDDEQSDDGGTWRSVPDIEDENDNDSDNDNFDCDKHTIVELRKNGVYSSSLILIWETKLI